MHYTIPNNRPFITRGEIKYKVKLSKECKAMNEYIDSHRFDVTFDAVKGIPHVEVSEKQNEK